MDFPFLFKFVARVKFSGTINEMVSENTSSKYADANALFRVPCKLKVRLYFGLVGSTLSPNWRFTSNTHYGAFKRIFLRKQRDFNNSTETDENFSWIAE